MELDCLKEKKLSDMCQAATISRSIGRLGRRSYDRRMRVVSPAFVERKGDMTRLCNSVAGLCDLLHEDFVTITKEDYEVFGGELRVLISTLKDLYADSNLRPELKESNERLRAHIEDLVELDHDIVNFRVRLQEDEEMKQTMKAIGKLDFSRFVK